MTEQDKNTERRRFFRINDDIFLEYDLLDENEYNNAQEELDAIKHSAFSMSAEFATLNNEFHPLLNNIKQNTPDIAQYLELLNQKIDALSQHLLESQIPAEDNKVSANLSASGIAFRSKKPINKGQGLRLRIVLFPEKVGIMVFGRVMHCDNEKDPHSEHLITVDFEHIRYEDQELMIKHNINKQILELRQRSESKDDEV